ncbi:rcc01693 family protein [Algirhabdus cladophorae]|uniref:rcc01693 family protein n=1 Tax=Algirhabdus cladophorae TaxID=3377108 RepID=UPI003B849B81
MSDQVNWLIWMQVGMRQLNLRPDDFWALTPAELMFLLGQDGAQEPLGRDQLAALSARFPDEKRTDK